MDRADNLRAIKDGTYRKGQPAEKKVVGNPGAKEDPASDKGKPPRKNASRVSAKMMQQFEDNGALAMLDRAFYLTIWDCSPHMCQCGCKTPLGEFSTSFFHHLLEKRNHPQFRHVPENIMILATDCHNQVEADIDKRPRVRARRDEIVKLLLNK